MMSISSFCPAVVSLVVLVVVLGASDATVTVTVDPVSGDDNTCLSIQQLSDSSSNSSEPEYPPVPCRTLNRALGSEQLLCSNLSCARGLVEEFQEGAVIRLADGEHRLSACVGIIKSENLVFEAINEGQAVIRCAEDEINTYNNMFFCGSRNISFLGLQFRGCGPISSNVFFNDSSDILFDRCEFRNNSGSPLQFRFSTGIRLLSCRFIENVNLLMSEPDTEDTMITDIYTAISTSGALTIFSRDRSADISILDCTFTSNRASTNPPNNTRPVLLEANGHGGAILIRLVGSHDSHILIEGNEFERNEAEVDGGAVYLSLSEFSSLNQVIFRGNHFSGNRVRMASGGAISINSFNFTFNNTLLVEDCNFTGNSGDSGGAFSMALYNSDLNSTRMPDMLNFSNSIFSGNSALNEGTAVGLFSLVHVDQVGFPVSFQNCTFRNNTSTGQSEDTSAIAAFRFPTVFSGYNHFESNVGGGITLLNTRMRVTTNSSLLFLWNRAVFGGGIAMDDRCLLEISNDVEMIFQENLATESGGGIYVEFPPIRFVVDIFNRLCFLQYNNGSGLDAPPQEWNNVVIRFSGNQARLSGAAIFASDMQQCSWLGGNFTDNNTLIFEPPPEVRDLYEDYPFQYENNTLLPEGEEVSKLTTMNLATSPANIRAEVVECEQDPCLVQPGETVPIDLLATDQVSNSREAIWSVEAPAQQPNLDALSANNDIYSYMVPLASDLPGVGSEMSSNASDPQDTAPPTATPTLEPTIVILDNFTSLFTLNFSLLRTLGNVERLNLNVSGCHPGYTYNNISHLCECDSDSNQDILRCDRNMRYIYLREGIWATTLEQDGKRVLSTARVQPGYVDCDSQGRLPGCRFRFDDPNEQCRDGRKGDLCGECEEGHGVTLDLSLCSDVNRYIGLGLFLFLLVVVVVVSTLILLFDIEVPNELKGFIFYAQVVGLVYSPYVVVQTESTHATTVIRALLNLLGLSVPIPLNLSDSTEVLKAHYVALLGYVSPILAIICILLFALGARFIRALGSHSALKGITFLFLFIYKYIADTSFIFVSCVETDMGLVFQYDGSQSCTAPEFAVFALLGLLLMAFFVAPTPFVISYICIQRPQRFQQYADVLTKGLKTKHHWWGGWDIGRRLPFVIIAFFIVLLRPSIVLFLMSLAALGVLIVHLFTKPFKKPHINIIEAAILLNLLLVTVAFLDPSNSPVPFELSTVLLFLPYAYALCYLLYRLLGRRLWYVCAQVEPLYIVAIGVLITVPPLLE